MKRVLFRSLLVVASMVFLCASVSSAKVIKLRFSDGFPTVQSTTRLNIIPWIDEINKKGEGKINIRLYPGGALGKAPDQYDLCEKGIADFTYHLVDYTPGRFPMTSVFSLPFMVKEAESASAAMYKLWEKDPAYQKEYDKVHVLALFGHSGGHFHTAKKPIRSMADFKGLKMRTANPAISEALKIWGATPIAMPITETYQSLERGVVDGTVLPYEGLGVFKLDEVTKYTTLAYLYTMPMVICMNLNKWNAMPDDIKELISSTTGLKMSMACGKVFDNAEVPFRNKSLKMGREEITLPPAEMEKMKESVKPLRAEWVKEWTAKGYPAQRILDEALNLLGIQ